MNVDEFEEKPEVKPEVKPEGKPEVKPGSSSGKIVDKFGLEPEKTVAKTAAKPQLQPQSQPQAETVAPKRSGGGLAWLAFLLALLALAAAAWLWWQASQSSQQQSAKWQADQQVYIDELKRLETSLANLQSAGSQQSTELSGDLKRRLEVLESNQNSGDNFRSETAAWNRAAQAALEDSQARLAAVDQRLSNLSARSAESSTELELEEIDYLLRMAQERLQLFGDTRTADRALQLADQQVQAFDNPMFIGLRREIAAARQALTAADVPDMVALSAELDKVQVAITGLPFLANSDDAEPVSTANEAETPWWDRLKSALSGLVTVRRIDDNELAAPALADQQALRQRAWLELEQARLAALRREQTIYQNSLAQAQVTINKWFDSRDAAVKQTLASIQALSQRNVNPELPDISGPWTALNSIREAGLSPATIIEKAQPVAEPTGQDEGNETQKESPIAEPVESNQAISNTDSLSTEDQVVSQAAEDQAAEGQVAEGQVAEGQVEEGPSEAEPTEVSPEAEEPAPITDTDQ